MGEIKKAIISFICVAIFIALWKCDVFDNWIYLVVTGFVLGGIAFKVWDS